MSEKKTTRPDPRGVRIPLDPTHWWPAAATKAAHDRARKLGIRAPGVRDLNLHLRRMGVDVDEDTVGRCLRGEIVTWEVAVPLSKILGIPAPVVMPTTQEEAVVLESDEIRALLEKLRRLG
jgi:hypothetical protein